MAHDRPLPRRPDRGRAPACRASPTSSTSASTTAASGRPPTTAAPGRPSSTISPPAPSGRWPSPRPIPTSSTSAAARACSGPTCPPATACTNPPTAARPGSTWACATASRFGAILVDPHDPDRVFVAVLGHPYGANAERGVFRSTDGGKTWQKVLYKDENTGAIALAFDPANPQDSLRGPVGGPAGTVGKRRLAGTRQAASSSRPTAARPGGSSRRDCPRRRRAWDASASRLPQRSKAALCHGRCAASGGLYRSDDAGESWRRVNSEQRVWGRGSDFAEVKVDPKNKDIIYVANTSTYRSTDGGKPSPRSRAHPAATTTTPFWINPDNPQIILLAGDQGAVISVNGGQTWSSWYNQPTAQFYHVITDNQFPYWVYGGQQESGSAGVASRGNDGQITLPRLASGGRRGIRLRRPRPAQSESHLRRQGDALRQDHADRCRTWPRRCCARASTASCARHRFSFPR